MPAVIALVLFAVVALAVLRRLAPQSHAALGNTSTSQ